MAPEPTPPSLVSLAQQQCLRFTSLINDVGYLNYDLVRPMLSKMPAKQLADIEQRSPQIEARSDELWRDLILREFVDRALPEDRGSNVYRETYYRFQADKEHQLDLARERLINRQREWQAHRNLSTINALAPTDEPRRRSLQWRSQAMQRVIQAAKACHSRSTRSQPHQPHQPLITYPLDAARRADTKAPLKEAAPLPKLNPPGFMKRSLASDSSRAGSGNVGLVPKRVRRSPSIFMRRK